MLELSLKEIACRLAKKEVSATEVTATSLKEIEKLNPQLNAFITVTPEQAMLQAKEADVRLAKGEGTVLTGVPLGLKDLFCTKGIKTTAGSKILADFVPPYESTVSQKLLDAGAVMVGKTNLDEFAMGSSNLTSAFGGVENPWRSKNDPDTALVPGGSSGGSAAAVAAFLVYGATGTDTGGSVRQPAAFCGIPGIKPTYGRCSRFGVVAFASSLDQPGPFARTVEDCALLLEAMAGHDPNDSTSANQAVPAFSRACGQSLKGKRIGVPEEYQVKGMPAEIEAAWQAGLNWLKEAGAEIVSVSLPHTKYGLAAYYIVAPAECSSNLARYDGVRYGLRVPGASLDELYEKTRAEGFGREVRRRILIGTYVLSAGYYDAYYVKAQKIRSLILKDFTDAFGKVDALLTPTAPGAAFAAGKKVTDPIEMYLNDVFTVPASMAGVPAMSVPVGLNKDGLPLGLQIIGRPFDEETVFTVASALEKAADFKLIPTIRAGE